MQAVSGTRCWAFVEAQDDPGGTPRLQFVHPQCHILFVRQLLWAASE